MDSNDSQPSLIDRAVQSLTTFSGTKVQDEEDWHIQFAADIDNEELVGSSHAGSKHAPSEIEELAAQQSKDLPDDLPLVESTALMNQQLLPRFIPFVRPSSSHESSSTSFAFGKPQPKHLDFSRKTSQNPKPSVPVTLPESGPNNTASPDSPYSPIVKPPVTGATLTCEVVPVPAEALSPSPSGDGSPTLVISVQDIGSPTALNGTSSAPGNSTAQAAAPPSTQGSPVTTPKVVEASHHETSEPLQPLGMPTAATQPLSPRVSAKVTKLRRKSKRADTTRVRASQPGSAKATLSYEDTLDILLVRYRDEQLDKEETRAALNAKEIELQDLREISNAIYHQLQQARQRENSREAELSRFHKVMPQWETRVKKLNDYVQSLTNDHQTLRDDAREIHNQQKILLTDKSNIASTLNDVRRTVEQDQAKTKKVLVEARHHMEMLEQTVSNQETQLQEDANLLDAERDRSQRLEVEMSKLTTSHQHLLELLTEHGRVTTEKLDDLLSKSEEVQIVTPPQSQDYVKPILDEAISILKELREADMVRPDDLRKLDASIRSYAEKMTRSFEACQQTSAFIGAGQKELVSEFQERLQALSASIATEHALTERLTDLHEVKATFRERLQLTETALADARQQVVALQNKDQLRLQKISALELEAVHLRNQPKDSSHTIFRVHELEIKSKDLQERSGTLQEQVAETSKQLRQKIADATEMESRLTNIQSQLEEAQVENLLLEEQKGAYESQFNAKLEQTKKELWKVANMDKAKTESKYQNQLHQVQQRNLEVDVELEQKVSQLNQLQAEKDAVEAESGRFSSLLAGLQAEKGREAEASATLRSRLTQLEREIGEKDQRLAQLEENLRLARNDIEAKDVHIRKLDHVQEQLELITSHLDAKDAQIRSLTATNPLSLTVDSFQSSHIKDQERPKRKANRAEKRLPSVVEDSQPNDIQTFTVNKPGSAKSNSISTPSRLRYDQSIGTTFVSSPLEDLDDMLDDLGDLAGLFPPTPVPAAQKLDCSKEKTTTEDIAVSREKFREEASPTKELTASHRSHSTTHKSIHFSQSANSTFNYAATSVVSQGNLADVPAQGSKCDKQDSQRQQRVSKPSSRRQSILKESTVEKRSASVAGLSPPHARGRSKRVKDLGPVIPDSQSPHGSRVPARNHRPAKLNSQKQPRDDKYSRRFSQELK